MTVLNYSAPSTISEVLELLMNSSVPKKILAGGTDIMPHLKSGLIKDVELISLKKIPELHRMEETNTEIRIGAAVTLQQLIDSPLLADLFPVIREGLITIGAPQHRQQGTIGGNLCLDTRCSWFNQSAFWRESIGYCMKLDGDVCHVAPKGGRCYALQSSDGCAVFCALRADIEIQSRSGIRRIPLSELYSLDGMNHLNLKPGELLTDIILRKPDVRHDARYKKVAIRKSFDFPLLGIAGSLLSQNKHLKAMTVVLTAVESAPLIFTEADFDCLDTPVSKLPLEAIGSLCQRKGTPMKNAFLTPAWRKGMIKHSVIELMQSIINSVESDPES